MTMEFYGINALFIKQYIEFKRNLGYAFKYTYTFKMFDRFTIENGSNSVGLTKELAEKWAEKRPNESDVTRYKRMNDIINFSIHLNHLGYQSYIPKQLKFHQSTFTPYIFSQKELKVFFSAYDSIEICRTSTMQYIIPIIFRMIYGCGLRANEALSLKCSDVYLGEKYIIIREAKNGRDRMLPLSDSLADICILYQKRCLQRHAMDDYFFAQNNMQKYNPSTLYKWF